MRKVTIDSGTRFFELFMLAIVVCYVVHMMLVAIGVVPPGSETPTQDLSPLYE